MVRALIISTIGLAVGVMCFFAGRDAAAAMAGIRKDRTTASLIRRFGFLSAPFDRREKEAAAHLMSFLAKKEPRLAEEALGIYSNLLGSSLCAGEHLTLRWLCEYFRAPDERKAHLLQDPFARRFIAYVSPGGFSKLREYLALKSSEEQPDDPPFLEELMRLNGPARASWESTPRVLDITGLKEGDRIADLGSAAGFHCLQFSERVGASGKVIAIESRTELRRYLSDIIRNEGIQNMKLGADVLALEEGSLDVAFMGDTYSTFYYAMRTAERTPVMTNIRKALRPGGKLVILGTPVPDRSKGVVFAPLAVSADLVALQVEAYGFRRAGAHAVNPLRYLLLFTVE